MTKIEWTHRPGTVGVTWNPVTGCTKISEGCAHCYAERMSKRLAGRFGYPADDPFRVTLHPDKLELPRKWKKPRTVFVCSMGDLFHRDVPYDEIAFVFHEMARSPQHTYLVLTKRPDEMLAFWKRYRYDTGIELEPPPSYIWFGVTCENQQRANERIPLLLQCPAAVRFVSVEPMLGPVDISIAEIEFSGGHPDDPASYEYSANVLDWVIVGGETGPGARPMHPGWARDIRDQCQAAGVPYFFKQMSRKAPIPDDLMIREWPNATRRPD